MSAVAVSSARMGTPNTTTATTPAIAASTITVIIREARSLFTRFLRSRPRRGRSCGRVDLRDEARVKDARSRDEERAGARRTAATERSHAPATVSSPRLHRALGESGYTLGG
jgi:hypothetical protein